MAYISITNQFVASSVANANQVNQNYSDIVNGLKDGTKDIQVASGIFNTKLTSKGDVVLGTDGTNTVAFNARVGTDILPASSSTYSLGSATYKFKSLYADTTSIGTMTASTVVGTQGQFTNVSMNTATIGTMTASTIVGTNLQVSDFIPWVGYYDQTEYNLDGTPIANDTVSNTFIESQVNSGVFSFTSVSTAKKRITFNKPGIYSLDIEFSLADLTSGDHGMDHNVRVFRDVQTVTYLSKFSLNNRRFEAYDAHYFATSIPLPYSPFDRSTNSKAIFKCTSPGQYLELNNVSDFGSCPTATFRESLTYTITPIAFT